MWSLSFCKASCDSRSCWWSISRSKCKHVNFAPICQSGYQEVNFQTMLLIPWYWWYCSAKQPKKRKSNILITITIIIINNNSNNNTDINTNINIIKNVAIAGDYFYSIFLWKGIYVWNRLVACCVPARWHWIGAFARAQCPFLARERWSRLGCGDKWC